MKPFVTCTGTAVPLIEDDVNTDAIAPGVSGPPRLQSSHAEELFRNRRFQADGQQNEAFEFNQDKFRGASILVTGRNFGCGSSRETAVWALADTGIRCIIARSFAVSFHENCLRNGILPLALPEADSARVEAAALEAGGAKVFTASLEDQTLTLPDGSSIQFDFAPDERERLLYGLDDIAMSERLDDEIGHWESRMKNQMPWLQRIPLQAGE